MNPLTEPESDHSDDIDLAQELTRRALKTRADSYRGGSRSPFYEACTDQCIAVIAKEIVALSQFHGRPLERVFEAAGRALGALQIAINNINEEYNDPD